jgi:hypothetical protein
MTVTTSGRRSRAELLAEAREKFTGKDLPSKTKFAAELGSHFNTASPVYDELARERAVAEQQRRRDSRAAMSKLRRRKRPVAVRAVPSYPFTSPSAPISAVPFDVVDVPLEEVPDEGDVQGPETPFFSPSPSLADVALGPVLPPLSPATAAPVVKSSIGRKVATWPALIVAAPAFVAIWAGWVGIGKLTGFGKVNLLPGFWKGWVIDTAITLPVGVEAYAGYAFYVALNLAAPKRARVFAAWTSLSAVALGMAGQTAYHLMTARHVGEAPWQITTVVSCLPVAVFGLAAALVHMVRAGGES